MTEYRAITVKRKWADAIADGTKQHEVRRFRTDYRGPVVVTVSRDMVTFCIVDLVDVVPSAEVPTLSDEERSFGAWAWVLSNPRRCRWYGCKGQLGLWKWRGDLPDEVRP